VLREERGRAAFENPQGAACAATVVLRRALAQRRRDRTGDSFHRCRSPGQMKSDRASRLRWAKKPAARARK